MAHPFQPAPIDLDKARLLLVASEARYAGVRWPQVVLGDSRASEWPEDLLARLGAPTANLGLPGAAVQHVLWRLHQTAVDLSGVTRAIVVLGINHLTMGHDPKEVAPALQQVAKLVKGRAPEAEVLMVEVFPRAPHLDYDDAARVELNRRLANRAEASGLYRMVPTRLDNPADTALFSDGLHLTRAGYEVLTQDVAAAIGPDTRGAAAYLRQDIGEVTVLADLGEGRPLVEDIASVVEDLARSGTGLAGRRLIGRETDGRWFAVDLADGRFQGLAPIGYMPLAGAIEAARARKAVSS